MTLVQIDLTRGPARARAGHDVADVADAAEGDHAGRSVTAAPVPVDSPATGDAPFAGLALAGGLVLLAPLASLALHSRPALIVLLAGLAALGLFAALLRPALAEVDRP